MKTIHTIPADAITHDCITGDPEAHIGGDSFEHLTNTPNRNRAFFENVIKTFEGAGEFGIADVAHGFVEETGQTFVVDDYFAVYVRDFGECLTDFWTHYEAKREQADADVLYRKLDETDPIAEIEKMTGQRVDSGSDSEVMLLALAATSRKSRAKEALLFGAGDTTFSMDADKYLAVVTDLGFIPVFEEQFDHLDSQTDTPTDIKETQYVLANPDLGVVLNFNTYSYRDEDGSMAIHRNSAHIQYCWQSKDSSVRGHSNVLSSGGWDSMTDPEWRNKDSHVWGADMFWFGDNDAREALRYQLRNLMADGHLMTVWPKIRRPQWTAFINWADWKILSYTKMGMDGSSKAIDALNKQRYETTPDWFKAMVNHNI